MQLSIEEARAFLIGYQGLTASKALSGPEGILHYIKKVGCVQYDPLRIIGRNADLVLQARVMDYRTEMLEQLLYKDRLLIDGWDKMMSIYSREDWPYFQPVRERKGRETVRILRYRNSSDALLYTDAVMDALSENGPMLPRQLRLGAASAGRWGHKNLASAAMDYLFQIGKIGVYEKENVNKRYALIGDLLPASLLQQPDSFASEYDFCKWYVYRRLGSVGMLWNRDGGGWLGQYLEDKALRQRILDALCADGTVQCVTVEGLPEDFYIRSADLILPDAGSTDTAETVRFLAPLDNLLWDRAMLSKLFGFDYSWEVYLPAAKRKYGYYVIPVLCGTRFIARFEPEKSDTHIQVKNWWWEQDVSPSERKIEPILREMERLAACFHKECGVHAGTYAKLREAGGVQE